MPMHARRVDWFRVLDDLARVGCTPYDLADLLGVPRSTVKGWKNIGHEPRFLDGFRLITIWMTLCDRTLAELPSRATGLLDPSVMLVLQVDWLAEFVALKARNRRDSIAA